MSLVQYELRGLVPVDRVDELLTFLRPQFTVGWEEDVVELEEDWALAVLRGGAAAASGNTKEALRGGQRVQCCYLAGSEAVTRVFGVGQNIRSSSERAVRGVHITEASTDANVRFFLRGSGFTLRSSLVRRGVRARSLRSWEMRLSRVTAGSAREAAWEESGGVPSWDDAADNPADPHLLEVRAWLPASYQPSLALALADALIAFADDVSPLVAME